MVRHECAEALGGIGAQGVEEELAKYVNDQFSFQKIYNFIDLNVQTKKNFSYLSVLLIDTLSQIKVWRNDLLSRYLDENEAAVVRESCVVALDMFDYANSKEFQYANAIDA